MECSLEKKTSAIELIGQKPKWTKTKSVSLALYFVFICYYSLEVLWKEEEKWGEEDKSQWLVQAPLTQRNASF